MGLVILCLVIGLSGGLACFGLWDIARVLREIADLLNNISEELAYLGRDDDPLDEEEEEEREV